MVKLTLRLPLLRKLKMSLKRIVALFTLLAVVCIVIVTRTGWAQSGPVIISGKFYRLDVVAAVGQQGFTNIFGASSINNTGVVSFIRALP